jgi:hypothetical protein
MTSKGQQEGYQHKLERRKEKRATKGEQGERRKEEGVREGRDDGVCTCT